MEDGNIKKKKVKRPIKISSDLITKKAFVDRTFFVPDSFSKQHID